MSGIGRALAPAMRLVMTAALGLAVLAMAAVALPTFFGYDTFIVTSGSMAPTLPVGAMAVVRPVAADALRVGDVVTYRPPGDADVLVTHRVVALERAAAGDLRLRTRGDANAVEDEVQIPSGNVVGRLAYAVPCAGYLQDFASRPAGRVLLLLVPALVLLFDYVRGRRAARPAPGAAHAPAAHAEALIRDGEAALAVGDLAGAAAAADAALQLDARSETAWVLKARTLPTDTEKEQLLRAAMLVNPKGAAVAAELAAVGEIRRGAHGGPATTGQSANRGAMTQV